MAKAKNKTAQTDASPEAFLAAVDDDQRREDAEFLLGWFEQVTGWKPKMWGPAIIGYGRYHYKYDSGREGEFMLTGCSPRKANLVMYIMPGYRSDAMQDKLARLGKYKLGKSCLYINKLSDVDTGVLAEIITDGLAHMRETYETWDE